MILSVLELFFLGGVAGGGGGWGGRGNQTRQSQNEQPMKAGLRTDNSSSCIEGSKPYTQFIASVLLGWRDTLVLQNKCISMEWPWENNELVWLIYNIRRRSDSVIYSGSAEI